MVHYNFSIGMPKPFFNLGMLELKYLSTEICERGIDILTEFSEREWERERERVRETEREREREREKIVKHTNLVYWILMVHYNFSLGMPPLFFIGGMLTLKYASTEKSGGIEILTAF